MLVYGFTAHGQIDTETRFSHRETPCVTQGVVANRSERLEALAVDDRGAALVVLLLRDPHLLEGGQRREDGAADPDRVLALGRRDDLDLHRGRREGGDLLGHAVGTL